jgi:hypothetical protein
MEMTEEGDKGNEAEKEDSDQEMEEVGKESIGEIFVSLIVKSFSWSFGKNKE